MLLFCTDSLTHYGLNRIFRFTKNAGYDGIEIAITNEYDTQNEDYIAELVKKYDLQVKAIYARSKVKKKSIEEAIRIAKALECNIVVTPPPDLLDFKLTNWIKTEVPKIMKKEKIHVCLENSDAKTFLGILPKYALNSLAELKSYKHVSLCTSNLAAKKIDLMRVYEKLQNVIRHVHLSNTKGTKSFTLPDNGILPLESFITDLKKNNYKGAISIRVNPKELHAGDDKKVISGLKKCKEFYETYFK